MLNKNINYEVPQEFKKKRHRFKNYRELCECFEWKYATGTQRQAQMKVVEQHFYITKSGYNIVLSPKDYVTKKESKRDLTPNGVLKKAVQKQIVRLVYNHVSNKQDVDGFINLNPSINMVISKNELIRSVWLMNGNTVYTYGNELVVSDMLQLDYYMFYDNYNRVMVNSKQTIDSALKGLSRILVVRDCFECILAVNDDSNTFEYSDGYWTSGNGFKCKHYITTDKHYDFIRLVAYPEILKKYGMSDLNDLYSFRENKITIEQFYGEVNNWIRKHCCDQLYLKRYGEDLSILKDIVGHYHKMNISFNDKFIKLEYEELGDLTPDELKMIQDKSYDVQEELNKIAELNIKRNNKLANKRHNDAVKLVEDEDNVDNIKQKHITRIDDNYTKVANAVSEVYINPNPAKVFSLSEIKDHQILLGKDMTHKKLIDRTRGHGNIGLKSLCITS